MDDEMRLERIDGEFTVCRVADYAHVRLDAQYCFIGKTATEKSLVCLTKDVPENATARDDGWRGFCIEGVLDFSLVGILAKISGILAENGIAIFALSTYNTDYVLVKKESYSKALAVLARSGYAVLENAPLELEGGTI